MGLKNLTKNIYFLPHEPEVDRPMLAYVKGDKFSLAVDAGYSKKHVQDFYRALRSCDKKDDTHFAKEYAGENELNIVIADIEYVEKMTLNLGNITAHIFHTVSPHSEDTTCIYIPEEKVLFLGDSTSEDFFNGGYMDKRKLQHLIERIYSIDCDYCVLSHCEPLKKNELLAYLNTLK